MGIVDVRTLNLLAREADIKIMASGEGVCQRKFDRECFSGW